MSLHNGIDTVGIVSNGTFSKTYGSSDKGAIACLFASLGKLEDAPNILVQAFNAALSLFLFLERP